MNPYGYAAVRARCRDCAREGADRGLEGRNLVVYLGLVCPEVPGTGGYRAWHDEKRRVAGRWRRRRGVRSEFTGYLPFDR